ncbi:sigma-54-dependent transcriptional regulator [Horticoccus sp. 23ND18S-11]|uniref:sigma-54-dependent transcriptional regulator n=1 Tax=Horticoccus sp. 23ND18S-11 TaxID=3391832 RepID=UPI0039C9EAD6
MTPPSPLADKHILFVDDIPANCQEMRGFLKHHCRQVTVCTSPLRALRRLRADEPDLLITTLVMKELGGLDVIRRVRGQGSSLPIVMITGYGNEQTAIEATRLGVSDYLEKPVAPDELRARLAKIFAAQERPASRAATPGTAMLSEDPAMKAIFDMVGAVARSDSRVLILGETGTGKQLIAQAIHESSGRRAAPFVEVNCAAIPENLLESELFGHERGAFTGATERRTGRFEEAGAGTLFLDEIGEMSFAVQSKLLRVLQDGKFNRVGGSATLQSRARVLAATNRDLPTEVEAGRFRADLFYRLHVITLTLPPLRRRSGDVPILAEHFLRRFRGPRGPLRRFSAEALQQLQQYGWPGNVRELEHLVERFAVLHDRPVIEASDLPEKIRRTSGTPAASSHESLLRGDYATARAAFERAFVRESLKQARGNMAEAARRAGLDRSHFFRLVRRQRIDPAEFR